MVKGLGAVLDNLTKAGVAGQKYMQSMTIRTADKIVKEAKRLCPVDTGHLRDSIKRSASKRTARGYRVIVGTPVRYAGYVEFGTRKMSAQPYLRPAFRKYGQDPGLIEMSPFFRRSL